MYPKETDHRVNPPNETKFYRQKRDEELIDRVRRRAGRAKLGTRVREKSIAARARQIRKVLDGLECPSYLRKK